MITKRKILCFIVTVFLVAAAFFYGMATYKYRLPPYFGLRTAYRMIRPPKEPVIPPEYLDTNVDQLIQIRTPEDVSAARSRLRLFLWGEDGLPNSLPSAMQEGFVDPQYDGIPDLLRIDKLTVAMEFGLESYLLHFIPVVPNGKAILYHRGHGEDPDNYRSVVAQFVAKGYSVIALCMPLLDLNNQPVVNLPELGRFKLTSHEDMKFLFPTKGHPIKYFVEPVVVALNYLEQGHHGNWVSMVGLSGGGWTTTLAAAVDTRIKLSFPVAGSYPLFLRTGSPEDWGDWEQTQPNLYRTVNYLDMYILGASGRGRKQLQILNKYDPCCFGGVKGKTYRMQVRSHVQQLGSGEFDLWLDDSHRQHIISQAAMNRILHELDRANFMVTSLPDLEKPAPTTNSAPRPSSVR